ncbi:hypothetical protein [Streptomyces europaeiscabiei]|uniref:hypothetical protein n=2 Tax=Streptomyces TaxID=1883 RepID=UPI002E19DC09
MYGSRRMTVIEQLARAATRVARVARVAFNLATHQASWSPTDLYAAAMTARFMAAHDLIDRAEGLVDDDPDVDLVQVRQPAWFGSTNLHEEN